MQLVLLAYFVVLTFYFICNVHAYMINAKCIYKYMFWIIECNYEQTTKLMQLINS